jgi:hypothetical protein
MAGARALIGDISAARRAMKASMDFNPNFDLRSRTAMALRRNRRTSSSVTPRAG